MDSRLAAQLELGKSLFYTGRLAEAYTIFRRYYDRVPFEVEDAHAEYAGIFVRLVLELGHEYDLKFYVTELEKHRTKRRLAVLDYQLALMYIYLKEPRVEAAKEILESILSDPKAQKHHWRAKLVLANVYSRKGDLANCRMLVDSIPDPVDPCHLPLVLIWRAVVLRHQERFAEARAILDRVIETTSPKNNWYPHFHARIAKIKVLVQEGALEQAQEHLQLLEGSLKGRRCRSISRQLDHLAELVTERAGFGTLCLRAEGKDYVVNYRRRTLVLDSKSRVGRLILLLLRKRSVNRDAIMKLICGRAFSAGQDERTIYTYIRYARIRLGVLGLPSQAIACRNSGYRLMPDVQIERLS